MIFQHHLFKLPAIGLAIITFLLFINIVLYALLNSILVEKLAREGRIKIVSGKDGDIISLIVNRSRQMRGGRPEIHFLQEWTILSPR